MRRLTLAAAVAASFALTGSAVAMLDGGGEAPQERSPLTRAEAQLPARPTFLVSGHGWGHGVGMSQYGAYGYAQHGNGYREILAHYYPGTAIGPAPLARVRVLLTGAKRALAVSSEAPLRLTDGSGEARRLPAGSYRIGPGLRLTVPPAKKPQSLPSPLLFAATKAPLAVDGSSYRGSIRVTLQNGKLQVVNTVGIDAYVQGVVPREMPFRWAPEALKAQAVAARSYALAHLKTGGPFDLYSDVRSQVYGGIGAEQDSTNAAVAATAGEVLLYGDEVADTFFFSTSGGRTAAVEDAWAGSEPVPYLVSVPDPYDSISPYHDWGPFLLDASKLQRKLRVPGRLLDLQTVVNPSARVATLNAVGALGDVSVAGTAARRVLGLRSTWFRIGVLSQLVPEQARLVYGSRARMSGMARDVAGVVLQARPVGTSAWQQAAKLTAAKDGTVTLTTKPQVTTDYRLAVGAITGVAVRVSLTPRVRFYPVESLTELRGYARPLLPGVTVQVQRLDGSTWETVAKAVVDSKGDFEAKLTLKPGTYRARMAPGQGFVPGVSPVLKVVGA